MKLVLSTVGLAGVTLLVAAALHGTLVYYHNPSEVAGHSNLSGQRMRLGGEVAPGSLRRAGNRIDFIVTDGHRQVSVVHRGPAPRQLREGQQAVVEGRLGRDRVFHSDQIIVKHSNEYRPAGRP